MLDNLSQLMYLNHSWSVKVPAVDGSHHIKAASCIFWHGREEDAQYKTLCIDTCMELNNANGGNVHVPIVICREHFGSGLYNAMQFPSLFCTTVSTVTV